MISKLKNLSLSTVVIICFGLGIVNGLVFGEMVAWMGGIGDAFIKLLQMTIIPYIVVSLITSLGKMSYEQAKSLGVKVGKLMLVFWVVGLLSIYLIQFIFPYWQAGSFFSSALLETPKEVDLIDLYIPSNPFFSLSNSYIPAIVVFCLATGIALICIKEKKSLMEQLTTLGEAFNTVTGYIVKLMPIGIFAMTSATAGTMELAEFERLQVYFAAHVIMTFILAYWVLPVIIMIITPFTYKDVAGIAKDAMVMAFAAGNIFIVIPLLIEHTKELFHKYKIGNETTDAYAEIIIPVVFSFPNLGKLLTIVFVLFAGWYSGSNIDFLTYIPMAINGLISLFGSVYLTVPMLLDSLELPTDLFQLYMVSSLLTSRFTSLLAAMNIFVLAVGGTAMLAGLVQINKTRLILYAALTPVLFAVVFGGSYWLLSSVISSEYVMDDVVKNMQISEKVPARVLNYKQSNASSTGAPRNITEIKKSGVLKVGYNPDQLPFSYFNSNDDLVGLDVELTQVLANELDVKVEYIPYTFETVVGSLDQGEFDIAISGLQMTTKRIQLVNFTRPVLNLHYAFVLKDHRVDEFETDELIRSAKQIRIAHVGDYPIIEHLNKKFSNLKFTQINSDKEYFDTKNEDFDALLISLEAGKTWTLLRPEYATMFRKEGIVSFPAAYGVSRENIELLSFMNSWLELQHTSGKIDQLSDYWISGKNAVPVKPRWSVIKDVLHWVEAEPVEATK